MVDLAIILKDKNSISKQKKTSKNKCYNNHKFNQKRLQEYKLAIS